MRVNGEFSSQAAATLAGLISKILGQGGRVFVNTEMITQIAGVAAETFKDRLSGLESRPEKLFFIGSNGHDLAPEGCRVLIRKQAACSCKKRRCGKSCCSKKEPHARIMN